MALVIEDGSQVAGANSYVTSAEIEAYADLRGITLTNDPEVLAIKAMDYVESLRYAGSKVAQTQPLQWPRDGVYIDGFSVSESTIPNELKNGQMAVAIAIDSDADPLGNVEPAVKKEKVGSLEVEYQDGAGNESIAKSINAALQKLLATGGSGSSSFVVSRA